VATKRRVDMRRKLRLLYFKLLRGDIEAHTTNAMVAILRLQLELTDRFEIGERLAEYERRILEIEERFQRLRSRIQVERP
jgi:hypothetical protein